MAEATTDIPFDYSYVSTIARIAVYDDLLSAPRIIQIDPAPTAEYIEKIASTVYEYAQRSGGGIPYSAIREVSENFIHARFAEVVISILDKGNTIRFADQGPGIASKEKAQVPGFTSAIEPMKRYIRGVGSGLPLVKEYLSFAQGRIVIEDNLNTGAVVTLTLNKEEDEKEKAKPKEPERGDTISITSIMPPLSPREKDFIRLFANEGALGVTDIKNMTDISNATIYNTLTKLEQDGILEKTDGKKRILTDFGEQIAGTLL